MSSYRVVVIDHHKTAEEQLGGAADLPSNLELNLDMTHSAAWLALQYFGTQVHWPLQPGRASLCLSAF